MCLEDLVIHNNETKIILGQIQWILYTNFCLQEPQDTVSDFSKSERNFSEQKHINHGKDLKIGEIKNGGNLNNSLVLITYF
jgi:hypothetical protein